MAEFGRVEQDLRVCEFFSGVGEIVKAAHSCGMGALGFEYLDDMQRQDFESPSGLQEALLMIQRCGPQSLIAWGTPCSSWVWISQAVCQRMRSVEFGGLGPMGDQSKQAVRKANMQVSRMCLLMLIAFAKMCVMLLE